MFADPVRPRQRAHHRQVRSRGKALLPHHGEFEPDIIGRAPCAACREDADGIRRGVAQASRRDPRPVEGRHAGAGAWYCPVAAQHVGNRWRAALSAGIGCHDGDGMKRNVVMGTHMGAEGAQWIGMAPFTDENHILGEHGGRGSSTRACWRSTMAASPVNITYKITTTCTIDDRRAGGHGQHRSPTWPSAGVRRHRGHRHDKRFAAAA